MAPAQTMHSVLESGVWLKIALDGEGVYKITSADIAAAGADMTGCPISTIRMMGRPNRALPERCADPRPDDLTEMAVVVSDKNNNGVFDDEDYIMFYATGCVSWVSSEVDSTGEQTMDYERNLYSDTTFCYLNYGLSEGKRVQKVDRTADVDTQNAITEFTECFYHEKELFNANASGRVWYGEAFNDSFSMSIDLVDYVEGQPVFFYVGVMGRSSDAFRFDVLDGETGLFTSVPVSAYSSVTFGSELHRSKSYIPASSVIDLKIKINAQQSATLYLDRLFVNYPRHLNYRGGIMPFSMSSDGTRNTVGISQTSSDLLVWDVTSPMEPAEVLCANAGDASYFSIATDSVYRFVAFEPDNAASPCSVRRIGNQNLHGVTNAEMIIFSPAKYLSYANEIADFHRVNDAMDVVAVPVEEVYDEFSAGNPDLTALRDFIRMVYLRGNAGLKYVLLLGKASYDVRNILGRGVDYVPTYETVTYPCNEVSSFCSDDYFGMLDDDDGPECTGKLDIAVGRIPIKDEADAVIAINKIRNYADITKNHGAWRGRQLFVADVGETYHTNSELCANLFENAAPDLLLQKSYFAAFPVVNVSSGELIPAATADLTSRLDNGTLVMFYSGHGGVTGLSKRSVFTTSDISKMQNGAMQPFVYTATCEFSKFDDPELISAGEQMLLRVDGGSIAMLTTTRSTYATNTVRVSKSLAPLLGAYDDDGKPYRFGDLVRLAKTNPQFFSYTNRGMVLFGDPALRMALPAEKISVEEDNAEQPLYPGQEIEKQCYITGLNGEMDTLFNGVADVTFYAGKTRVETVLLNSPRSFLFYNDVVYQGTVTVHSGRFTVNFVLPTDVDYDKYYVPKAFFYAYDSIRGIDASGAWRGMHVDDGYSEISDFDGPDIEMFWNNADFNDGDTVVPSGDLHVRLADESGIYHYNYLIGRDIVLTSSLQQVGSSVLNDSFVPSIDDCRSGTITIPFETLPTGDHTFTIKAWDMCGNSSVKTIELHVIDNMIYHVSNYPNPFNESTTFVVSSSLPDGAKVLIEIYNIVGQKVAELSSDACYGATIEWNGTNFVGARLGAGVYPYRVTVSDSKGARRSVMQKLVITQ